MKIENLRRAARIQAELDNLDAVADRFVNLSIPVMVGQDGAAFVYALDRQAFVDSALARINALAAKLKAEAETL